MSNATLDQTQIAADAAAQFAAAHPGAVAGLRNREGRPRAVGRDGLVRPHRMSANDLASLAVGEAAPDVLTSAITGIVDQLWVLNPGDSVLCLTSPGRATRVRRWLSGYIFYNDKVKFEDASAELGQIGLFGPRAAEVAEAVQPGAA